MAAHQGREQDTLDLIMEPQVLVGVLDAIVVEPVWWIVFEVTHLVNHPRGFFLFAYIEAAGDLAVVGRVAFIAVEPALIILCNLPDSNRHQ